MAAPAPLTLRLSQKIPIAVRAAIDVERLPGDEVRAITREKCNGRSDVARPSDATPRNQRVTELGRVARMSK